jgi:hypothetical protein
VFFPDLEPRMGLFGDRIPQFAGVRLRNPLKPAASL